VLILTVIQGPDKGRKFELPDHEPQLIGRSSEALPIDDNAISRRHAELTPDDGVWWIRDLQSQNGTYVNGVKIGDRTKLRPGDQIRTGQTLFVFGQTASRDLNIVRVVGPRRMDSSIDKALPSIPIVGGNDDSIILAEPEPRAAAVDHLRVIYLLTTMLTTRVMERQQLLQGVMDLVFAEFSPQRGCLMLRASTPGAPTVAEVVKYKEPPLDQDEAKIHVSRTILHHAMQKGEGVLCTNAMTDPRFASGDSVQRLNIRSAICSPIRFRERTYGAIYIDSSVANYTFTQEQLALMNAIGQHVGLALSNAELYQQKLQSERLAAIGETVATLSHAIKNILQGLRGGADVVEMGLNKNDLKIAKGGWVIQKRNLDRIISLTMNMLAFSRQRGVELELIRIAPIIDECAQVLEGQCSSKQVAMIVDVDPEMPPVPLDAPLLHQAILNLLTNAVEAVEAGTGAVTVKAVYRPGSAAVQAVAKMQGKITLPDATRRTVAMGDEPTRKGTPAEVEILVIDNGPGIPPSKQPWVFEPFNTTKGTRGTGLGLAVAKRIVEEHGGRISIESVEGKGATFKVLLPAEIGAVIDPSATTASKQTDAGQPAP
jgi:signal transduction histidine kinase